MKYQAIDNTLFIENRKKLTSLLPQNALAIFNANDIMPTNADGTMGFQQNSDLFYLTGIDQEETLLLIFPNHPDPKKREILIIKETSEQIAIWEGYKYTKEHAREVSGIQTVYWTSQMEAVLNDVVFETNNIFLNLNEHSRNSSTVQSRDRRFIDFIKDKYPLHTLHRAAPIMHQLRATKNIIEIDLIKKAADITAKGFNRLLDFVKPNVTEFEIEAELIHEFIRNRSKGFAYQPIIASGANACVLHYIENNQVCKDGDLILLDVAAEYANYNSDLTRTIPVNGRFSPRQKQVYKAVYNTFRFAESILTVGQIWNEYQKEVEAYMEGQLIDIKLLSKNDVVKQNKENPLLKKYFMHGTSHHLGLDVHDVGNRYRKFEAGMVFTIEPGIYIREEGLGIRLENNFVITPSGNTDLMANIPIELEHIEELMNK